MQPFVWKDLINKTIQVKVFMNSKKRTSLLPQGWNRLCHERYKLIPEDQWYDFMIHESKFIALQDEYPLYKVTQGRYNPPRFTIVEGKVLHVFQTYNYQPEWYSASQNYHPARHNYSSTLYIQDDKDIIWVFGDHETCRYTDKLHWVLSDHIIILGDLSIIRWRHVRHLFLFSFALLG